MYIFLAQAFPPDPVSLNLITNIKQDVIGWAYVLIVAPLTILAVRKIILMVQAR